MKQLEATEKNTNWVHFIERKTGSFPRTYLSSRVQIAYAHCAPNARGQMIPSDTQNIKMRQVQIEIHQDLLYVLITVKGNFSAPEMAAPHAIPMSTSNRIQYPRYTARKGRDCTWRDRVACVSRKDRDVVVNRRNRVACVEGQGCMCRGTDLRVLPMLDPSRQSMETNRSHGKATPPTPGVD